MQQKTYFNGYWDVRFSSKTSSSYITHSKKWNIKKILLVILWIFLLTIIFWFSKNVVRGLPDIDQINDMVFSESTIIQDRNGKELYKLFEENREYVPISGMSQNMINAIVAMEDQRYREHDGLDPMGILRAGVSNVVNPGWWMQWASTISQQLLKNLLLNQTFKRESTQEKIIRKLREVMLIGKLNSVLEKQIKKENPSIKKDVLHKEMKNKTLELYLNYISFWNNAFGVEAASKTYFAKSAKDLNVLEASILASIPKSPTIYNPYKNREKVLWKVVIKTSDWTEISETTPDIMNQIVSKLSSNLESLQITKGDSFVKQLESVTEFTISSTSWGMYTVKYNPWRKDFALMRMYDDEYITQNELKQSFLQGITYELRKNKTDMLAPHFVQWVIEELEKKYDKETLTKWGIIIKTTLDLEMQKLAEESLVNNAAVLQENGANNSSMIYIDSQNGDVLSYVGSINYFDENIQWQNDMVRRPRQSWSSIKPFIYALGFEKLPITLDTPIFDIPFKIGQDQPNNAEGKFSWLLPLKYALWHSRNIPATKMILALWGEEVAKPFLKSLWIQSIKDEVEYWYTLALWAAEIPMLELANAYMHLSYAKPAEINPILEIRSRDGSLIYQKEKKEQTEIIPAGIRTLMWNILSEPANRLWGWATRFNVQWLRLWLKTGTSNVKSDRGNRPRDWWLAAYNGSKVALFWAWNANWNPMNRNAYGWTIHANPMRNFFTALLRNNYITNDIIPSVDVTSVSISKISWKAATENTPSEFVVSSQRYIRWVGLDADAGATPFEYDTLCNGLVSPTTPSDSIKKWYLIQSTSFMPNKMDLLEISEWRKQWSSFTGTMPQWWFSSGDVLYNYSNIFIVQPKESCKERETKEDLSIAINIISPIENKKISNKFSLWYEVKADRGVKSVVVFADGQQIAQFPYKGINKTVNEISSVTSQLSAGKYTIEILAVDTKGYSNKASFPVEIISSDKTAPTILESKTKVEQRENGKYQINIIVEDDLSFIEYGKISVGTNIIYEFKWNVATFVVDKLSAVSVFAKDAYGNTVEKTIDLTTL